MAKRLLVLVALIGFGWAMVGWVLPAYQQNRQTHLEEAMMNPETANQAVRTRAAAASDALEAEASGENILKAPPHVDATALTAEQREECMQTRQHIIGSQQRLRAATEDFASDVDFDPEELQGEIINDKDWLARNCTR